MRIGLDFHGVIDAEPELFSKFTQECIKNGWEIHILTGQEDTPELRETIKNYGIHFTHFFSITTYHKELGTKITYDEKGNPWMDESVWNRTKAIYCYSYDIDIHIDDSDIYGKYFDTTYLKLHKINNILYLLPVVINIFGKVFKLWLEKPQKVNI